jgi:hypothetical protein
VRIFSSLRFCLLVEDMTAAAAAASQHILDLGKAVAASERAVMLAFVMLALGAMMAWPLGKILLAATVSVVTLHFVQRQG